MKLLTTLLLIIPFFCYSQHLEQNEVWSHEIKISIFTVFEKQGFEEPGINSQFYFLTFDKHGPSVSYGANFQLSRQIFFDFQLDYGLG